MEPLKIGDVVQLKSGGPIMTVNGFMIGRDGKPDPDDVQCTWFDSKKELKSGRFPAATLERYDPSAVWGGA